MNTGSDLRGTRRGTPGNTYPDGWGTEGVCTEGTPPLLPSPMTVTDLSQLTRQKDKNQ